MTSLALPAPIPDVLELSIPVPPASLERARADRDGLARLLDGEHRAAADFLVALSDFDRRRGWERLGHGSLFAFLTRELALSKGAAYLRLTAARLLPRFPAVEAALRSGRLCLSAVGELARVLTEENEAEVLPRFAGCSTREAREVAASIRPVAAPPIREVVTRLAGEGSRVAEAAPTLALFAAAASVETASLVAPGAPVTATAPGGGRVPPATPAESPRPAGVVLTHEPLPGLTARELHATTEPLTADLRRLHLTVSKRFLEKAERARHGQSHGSPNATMEQVLEAALDLLLERQARRKALVKRPRATVAARLAAPCPPPTSTSTSTLSPTLTPTSTPTPAPTLSAPAHRPAVPAAVERAVRLRDGDRCQFPLDMGGVCGSTWRVELDHAVPFALGGETSVVNLRCLCARHNRAAAEAELGAAARQRRGQRRTGGRAARQGGWSAEPPRPSEAGARLRPGG